MHGRTRAALEELAATLPRPVEFDGELYDAELYDAVAAVLTVLTRAAADSAVAVDLSVSLVLVTAPAGHLSPAELRSALAPDAERIAALGGAMTAAVTGGTAVVSVRLSPEVSVFHQRVCELVRQGQEIEGPDGRRWDAVAERLSTRSRPRAAAVDAARHAFAEARELTSGLPADHPLRWAVDRIGADTHEIAELDLLDDLERGEIPLLRGATADAARLLGAHGTDPRTRLGLTGHAGDEQVRHAAGDAVRRWRAQAERPGTGWRDRAACEVLARAAEGLLGAELPAMPQGCPSGR